MEGKGIEGALGKSTGEAEWALVAEDRRQYPGGITFLALRNVTQTMTCILRSQPQEGWGLATGLVLLHGLSPYVVVASMWPNGARGRQQLPFPHDTNPTCVWGNHNGLSGTSPQESSTGQLEKGLRALSRELSERTGQLKQLIRNNFDRFINCKDAIDDIHAKMRKTLVRAAVAPPTAAASVAGSSALSPPSQLQLQQQQQPVATERVFRSLEQVHVQARRTFGPILDRAAKADRIRAVSSLLQRFDHLFAAPQRVIELAARGELEQVRRALGGCGGHAAAWVSGWVGG